MEALEGRHGEDAALLIILFYYSMPTLFIKDPGIIRPDTKERPADKLYRLILEAKLPRPDYCEQQDITCPACSWAGSVLMAHVVKGVYHCPLCLARATRGKELIICKLARQWRADFAWQEPIGVLVEVQGAIYDSNRGRHVRALGYTDNIEKRNAANLLGWRGYEFTPEHIDNGYAITLLRVALDPSNNQRPPTSHVRKYARIIQELTHFKGTTRPKKK